MNFSATICTRQLVASDEMSKERCKPPMTNLAELEGLRILSSTDRRCLGVSDIWVLCLKGILGTEGKKIETAIS